MKIHAVALVNKHLHESALKTWVDQRCQAAGIEVRWEVVTAGNTEHYKPLFFAHANVLTWSFRMPHAWMAARGKNVLYMQTSLIHQPSGVFVDHGGFFSDSHLCRKQTWRENHDVDVADAAKRWFGWKFGAGGQENGPLLVALQTRMDASMRHYYPAAASESDKVVHTLKLLSKYLPCERQVLIRPHPSERRLFTTNFDSATRGHWRHNWELDLEETFANRLPQCSALVTVNSTCASEATLLGIPTATLGLSAFTGSGVTMECSDNPSRLHELASWHPNMTKCTAYAQAVLGRHFLPYDARGAASAEFDAWLQRARTPLPMSANACP